VSEFDALRSWATVRELEYIEAVERHGSMAKASTALGLNKGRISEALRRLTARAALKGYSPAHDMTKPVPDGFKVRGVSSLYDKDGKLAAQWVKSSADDERREGLLREAVAALAEEIPRARPVKGPSHVSEHLCNVFTLTDSHVGMLAWGKEAGADWDLKIAEQTLVGCFSQMILASPVAKVAVVAQLGDFLHQDGLSPVTPTSGHVLDSDGRFSKVVQVAVRTLRKVVDMALASHDKVVVLMAEGNHDLASSVWLRTLFAALYENEPRVEVIDSPLPYYVYRHGTTMLAWHHGHLKKNDQLPMLFAAQFPQEWGATTRRYAHCGHRHHVEEKEHSGMTVIQHATLAARDAYAARGGWIADRQVSAITYHDRFGQVARATVVPEMLEAA
jgi:hypothetical protein